MNDTCEIFAPTITKTARGLVTNSWIYTDVEDGNIEFTDGGGFQFPYVDPEINGFSFPASGLAFPSQGIAFSEVNPQQEGIAFSELHVAVVETIIADVQPKNLTEYELAAYGMNESVPNTKAMFYFGDNTNLVTGNRVRVNYGSFYEIKARNDWPSHTHILLVPIVGIE